MIVVAIIGILAAIAIPQYQNYIARTQVARVMSESGQLRTSIEVCINEGRLTVGAGAGAGECDPGATGSNLLTGTSQTSGTLPGGTGVPQVQSPLTTTATIIATFGNAASAALGTAPTLTWTRNADGGWTCATTVDAKYRPRGCDQ